MNKMSRYFCERLKFDIFPVVIILLISLLIEDVPCVMLGMCLYSYFKSISVNEAGSVRKGKFPGTLIFQ